MGAACVKPPIIWDAVGPSPEQYKIFALAKLPYRVVQPPTQSQRKYIEEVAWEVVPDEEKILPPPRVLTLIEAAEASMQRCKAVVFFGDPLAKCVRVTPPNQSEPRTSYALHSRSAYISARFGHDISETQNVK